MKIGPSSSIKDSPRCLKMTCYVAVSCFSSCYIAGWYASFTPFQLCVVQTNNEKLLENPYLQMRGILQLSNDLGSGL